MAAGAGFAAAAPWIAQAVGGLAVAGVNAGAGKRSQRRQFQHNMTLAEYQHVRNMEMLERQLDYNSPASQMARFKEAGLNPNLAYSQGDPGNWQQSAKYPDIQPTDMSMGQLNLGTQFQQARLMAAQADLTNVRVEESTVKQDLQRAQTALVKANPYLNEGYVQSFVSQMQSQADIKYNEALGSRMMVEYQRDGKTHSMRAGALKVMQEVENLTQRFNLNQADQKIKAEIFESKEMQNALQRIQLDWMRDGSITPEHWRLFIMSFLPKFR